MTDSGIRQMMERRGQLAGVEGLHPHRLRHQFAHQWLAAGGAEQDLMRLAGWRSRQMLGRYAASAADQRARDAHKRMGLGDRIWIWGYGGTGYPSPTSSAERGIDRLLLSPCGSCFRGAPDCVPHQQSA